MLSAVLAGRAELSGDRLRQLEDDAARHLKDLRDLVQAELRLGEQREEAELGCGQARVLLDGHASTLPGQSLDKTSSDVMDHCNRLR